MEPDIEEALRAWIEEHEGGDTEHTFSLLKDDALVNGEPSACALNVLLAAAEGRLVPRDREVGADDDRVTITLTREKFEEFCRDLMSVGGPFDSLVAEWEDQLGEGVGKLPKPTPQEIWSLRYIRGVLLTESARCYMKTREFDQTEEWGDKANKWRNRRIALDLMAKKIEKELKRL